MISSKVLLKSQLFALSLSTIDSSFHCSKLYKLLKNYLNCPTNSKFLLSKNFNLSTIVIQIFSPLILKLKNELKIPGGKYFKFS